MLVTRHSLGDVVEVGDCGASRARATLKGGRSLFEVRCPRTTFVGGPMIQSGRAEYPVLANLNGEVKALGNDRAVLDSLSDEIIAVRCSQLVFTGIRGT